MTDLPTGFLVVAGGCSLGLIVLAGYVVWGGDLDRWLTERRRNRRKGFVR